MRLNQRQIEIFDAVMTNKSVTAAAHALRTSQPTVSRELRDLEKHLGFDLFHRFGRRLTPTNAAQTLHKVVRRSFVGLDEIGRAAVAIGSHNATYLRVACIPAYAEALLPQAARRFSYGRHKIVLSIHSLEESLLQHDLATQMFDIGLTEGHYDHDGVSMHSFEAGDLMCALPIDHPLASRPLLRPEDFEGVGFVYFTREDPYRRTVDEIFESRGVNRRLIVETTTATSVCSMVANGVGVAIVNPLTAIHYLKKGIVLRPFEPAIPYRINLWRPKPGHKTAIADEFVGMLRQVCDDVRAQVRSLSGAGQDA